MLLNFMYSALSDVSLLHCLSGSFISDDRTLNSLYWCKNIMNGLSTKHKLYSFIFEIDNLYDFY
nr:hypothetical protein [Mycoplasmopsis bovis]